MASQKALDKLYMKWAYDVADLSYCERKKVGAVIVSPDYRLMISYGYNGTPPGEPNICEDENGLTKPDVLHAEENAILKLATVPLSAIGGILYVTVAPCMPCARKIVSVGIKRIVYGGIYSHHDNGEFFKRKGILMEYYFNDNEL